MPDAQATGGRPWHHNSIQVPVGLPECEFRFINSLVCSILEASNIQGRCRQLYNNNNNNNKSVFQAPSRETPQGSCTLSIIAKQSNKIMLDQQKYKIKISFQGTTYETNMSSIAT